MMLVHKQPPLHLAQPALTHRRHPSAPPTVIVQPTRTPGLLSLSKPPAKVLPQRPKQRTQQPPRSALLNAAEITDKKAAVRPTKKQAKPSDAAQRNGKPRQPSPPLNDPSQAEDSSDPFLDFSSTTFKPSIPRQKRRSHQPLTVHTPSKAIPVPAAPRAPAGQQLSRSVPTVLHSWEHICDDSNDEGPVTPPTTPLRGRPAFTSPFSGPMRDTPKRKPRNHKRTNSDHIFAMSSDDEAHSSGQEDLRALLHFVRSGSRPASTTCTPPPKHTANSDYFRSLSPASREKFFELEAQKEVAAYFASSSFQNSPSPDDLPDPTFA